MLIKIYEAKSQAKDKKEKKSVNKNASALFWLVQTRLAGGNSESQHEIYRLLIKVKIILALS